MNRWQEGIPVDLKAELPALKADCQAHRAQNGFVEDGEDDELLVAEQVLGLRTK